MTLESFIPDDQEKKLPYIQAAAKALEPAFKAEPRAAPSDEDNVAALHRGADALRKAVGEENGPGAEAAARLAAVLLRLAKGDQALRARAEAALLPPLKTAMDGLRLSLQAEPITADNVPQEIKENWVARRWPRPCGGPSERRSQ